MRLLFILLTAIMVMAVITDANLGAL